MGNLSNSVVPMIKTLEESLGTEAMATVGSEVDENGWNIHRNNERKKTVIITYRSHIS